MCWNCRYFLPMTLMIIRNNGNKKNLIVLSSKILISFDCITLCFYSRMNRILLIVHKHVFAKSCPVSWTWTGSCSNCFRNTENDCNNCTSRYICHFSCLNRSTIIIDTYVCRLVTDTSSKWYGTAFNVMEKIQTNLQ